MPGIRRVPIEEPSTNSWGESLMNLWEAVSGFLLAYGIELLIFALVLGGGVWVFHRLWKKHKEIEKLWIFVLFFLTKRQMMIPLVITLSERDEILDGETRQKLLDIREKCRGVSFKKSPQKRLEIEKEVSEILFFYFSELEKKDQIKPGTKFEKIVKDLEFIDAKLVQLQQVYNLAIQRHNKIIGFPIITYLFRVFRLRVFEGF